MEECEAVLGKSTYPWRIEFLPKVIKVFNGSKTVITIKSKYIKEISFETFLAIFDEKLRSYFKVKPQWRVIELEAAFTEWKKCLK